MQSGGVQHALSFEYLTLAKYIGGGGGDSQSAIVFSILSVREPVEYTPGSLSHLIFKTEPP